MSPDAHYQPTDAMAVKLVFAASAVIVDSDSALHLVDCLEGRNGERSVMHLHNG